MTRHHHLPKVSFVVLCLLGITLAPVISSAQRRLPVTPTAPVPTPKSVLGFEPGDDRTIADWHQITDYFARLDKASDRVLVQTIGESTLKHPIIVVFISARENILALDRYREIQQQLADPRLVATSQERDRLLSEGKVVVAVSCSIHSNEIVGSQMSLQLAY